MSSPITTQANKVWQLLTASSTATTYQQALGLTISILKETAQLLWLLLCLVLVAGDWFWKQSILAGRKTRVWVDQMGSSASNSTGDPKETATQIWQNLVASSQSAAQSLLAKARQQLNIPEPEATPSAAPPPMPSPMPSPVPTPVAKPPEPPAPKPVEPLQPTETAESTESSSASLDSTLDSTLE